MARARARYTIEAEDRTDRGLRSAEGRLRSFQRIIEVGLGNVLARISERLGGWARSILDTSAAVDDLAKRAKDLGQSLAEAQAVELFANLQGAAVQQVTTAIERVRTFLGEVSKGSKEARRDLDALGLTLRDFEGRTGLGALALVGAALPRAGVQETAIRRRVVGRGTGRLFEGDFIGAAQRAGELGLTTGLTQEARRAEAIEDASAEIGAIISRGFQRFFLGGDTGDFRVQLTEGIRDAVVSAFNLAFGDPSIRREEGRVSFEEARLINELAELNRQLRRERERTASGTSTFDR